MSKMTLSEAFYRHPAFWPHWLIKKMGLKKFWIQNSIVGLLFIVILTWCAWWDGAFRIHNGYGYLQHPGIFGWYAIQLIMPLTIINLFIKSLKTKQNWTNLNQILEEDFYSEIYKPTKEFVGLKTKNSRKIFALLFTVGFAGFAWNTFQNLYPGVQAPLDFWDSINFKAGYLGTRINKFYMHALLLPSILHIFGGIVYTQLKYLRLKSINDQLRISPFDPDGCGGLAFLADLIMSPTIFAIMLSGGAYYGVIYTHRTIDISTAMGSLVIGFVFVAFYFLPTMQLRKAIILLRNKENKIIHEQQNYYYNLLLERKLYGDKLNEALNYIEYFDKTGDKINRLPLWPHISRIVGTIGVAVTLPLATNSINLLISLAKVFSGQN
ncbi:hypothetical protein [Desulfovibrio sp. JC022]|uniref:hypothetical protein n=1 Tax=Desulfovibrio sp. JC022 TaxID=2593642 RepID=UPI0013CF5B53|nr:hypothetical protein [Desulfovibrio sp. JC022]NDV23809.1 hypothetical protein [Desulfovibrio sp. JC022]